MKDFSHETICESGRLIDAVLLHTPVLSAYLDHRFNFIWVNSAYALSCQHDPSFFTGKNHFDLYPNAENQAIFQRVVESGESFSIKGKPFEFPDQPERGVTYWDWNLLPVKGEGMKTRGLIFTLIDVTDRKRAEAALTTEQARLRQTVSELARSNRDLEQFASVASHDLKEPLRMITGFMSLLKEHAGCDLDGKAVECIRYAEEGGARLQQLVDDLLAYSHVGKEQPVEAVDVGAIVREVLSNLQACLEESGATVRCDLLPIIQASRLEVTQLFQNLLGNATKFRRAGVTPEIQVRARREGDLWLFQVEDNGIGIDPEYRERIFRIFERLHSPDKYPGTGIGLAICKKIIERRGGEIWVDAKESPGSIFTFTLRA